MIGDIFLVRGGSKFSTAIVNAQKILYPKAKSSHIEFYLGDGSIIHSTGDNGVHLSFLLDELKDIKDEWKVIRLRGLTEQDTENLAKAAIFFLRQEYNVKYMMESVDNKSFCSELIAKIYMKANVTIFDGKDPGKIAPAHFDKEADLLTLWEDVTSEYHQIIKDIKEREFEYRFLHKTIQGALAKRHILSHARQNLSEVAAIISEETGDEGVSKLFDKAKRELSQSRTLDFWDENDTLPYKK
ncbi:YiiX/YebB-like N1pC/P60 family cysteine hydrolase [Enterobacter sp. CC120223-11]|uniref:YiiX/YebB-like N1pC/P60 family cysteine hydrolase n=1 Tax=Enterobacter sp. CC120223-11 TaxID=1378073 RepID=UPI000BD67DBC|nr:YiiX/YebB-like N1pC/P60 family cysteine hydrolase [Enterobacter sp. CC120223-11]SNY61381.1 Permuted papain-like amidase enzyme, YaeF/YiiX, C92 family [Enterobacter sp. CC120223-11]